MVRSELVLLVGELQLGLDVVVAVSNSQEAAWLPSAVQSHEMVLLASSFENYAASVIFKVISKTLSIGGGASVEACDSNTFASALSRALLSA